MKSFPQVKFRKMPLENNISIIKWAYFEKGGPLSVHQFVVDYYPELKDLGNDKEEIYRKIEEVVTRDYYKCEEKIEKEVERYNLVWEKVNDLYMEAISKKLNTSWQEGLEVIDATVGLIPVFPRYLDYSSFAVSTNVSDDMLIEVTAHECLHFIWFKKWKELYPECPRKYYDSPYKPWQYSEMVTDPILNSPELSNILNIYERAYDSFYELEYDGKNVMEELKMIYESDENIEKIIRKGYSYVDAVFNKEDSTYKNKK